MKHEDGMVFRISTRTPPFRLVKSLVSTTLLMRYARYYEIYDPESA